MTVKRSTAICLFATFALMTFLSAGTAAAKGNEIRLRAELTAPASAGDVSGKADFRNRLSRLRRQFSVQIEGAAPGDMYDVMVAGVIVGTIVVNGAGIGEIGFDDTAGPNDQKVRFPRNFPDLDGGEIVQIGPLSGTLQHR